MLDLTDEPNGDPMNSLDHLDLNDRWRRCCDDERELLLAAAERQLKRERLERRRDRSRRIRRLVAGVLGWPYPARPRRVARHIAAAAWQ